MKKSVLVSLLFGIFMLPVYVNAQQDSKADSTRKEAVNWFHKKQWLGGLQLKPDKSIDAQALYRQYLVNQAAWDKAFAFLKTQNLERLTTGKHEIDGDNVYATVANNPTKDFEETRWESHRKYIDIQYVIEGEQLIGIHPVNKSVVTQPYDAEKDIMFYSAQGKMLRARPGTFFIFFPSDAHRPDITPGGNKAAKKIVIKIRAIE